MRSPTPYSAMNPLEKMIDFENRNRIYAYDLFDAAVDYAEEVGECLEVAVEAYMVSAGLRRVVHQKAIEAEWSVEEMKQLMESNSGTAT